MYHKYISLLYCSMPVGFMRQWKEIKAFFFCSSGSSLAWRELFNFIEAQFLSSQNNFQKNWVSWCILDTWPAAGIWEYLEVNRVLLELQQLFPTRTRNMCHYYGLLQILFSGLVVRLQECFPLTIIAKYSQGSWDLYAYTVTKINNNLNIIYCVNVPS